MIESTEQVVNRTLNNFCRVPAWNTVMSGKEVDHLLQTHGDTLFCNGRIRTIKVKKITNNNFKVYTEAA
jgi:hypothetical protein